MTYAVLLMTLTQGCSSIPPVPVIQDELQKIPKLEHVDVRSETMPKRPTVQVIEHQGVEYAAVDKAGMVAVLEAFQKGEFNAKQLEALNRLNAALVDERNSILKLAQDEEVRGNKLRADLQTADQRLEDQHMQYVIDTTILKLISLGLLVVAL